MGASATLGRRDIRGMFFKRLEEVATASWVSRLAMMIDSDQSSEILRWLGQVPAMRELIGTRHKREPRPYELTIINRTFEATVEFAVKDMRRDKTGQIRIRISDLAKRAATLPQKVLTETLENNGNAYDGNALFADRSALDTGGQYDNIVDQVAATGTDLTSDEMVTAIMNCVEAMMGALDDEGEPINEFAQEFAVMVPANYWGALMGALRDDFTAAGVSNTLKATSASGFSFLPIANPRLTTATSLYVARIDSDVAPLIWQDEVETELDELGAGSDHEFFNRAHVYGAVREGEGAPGEPGMICRVDVT